ncbi:MAG: 4'-phosphopantetheinyl transferase superfamily protein [Caldilineae bacterium]|nr:MAG: 4'-phosphopantetheinyl transferase superfamily protein [Caldilineae bacterium]
MGEWGVEAVGCERAARVWWARLDPPWEVAAQMEAVLAPEEWARVRRMPEEAGRRFVVRRGALRHLLAEWSGASPAALRFCYGPQGKPALAPPWSSSGLRFSVADSGEVAVFAVAQGVEVGVDVEAPRALPDALALAERFLSLEEAAWVRAQPAPQQGRAFLRCWTCKEAVLKARGDGLRGGLADFTAAHWETPPRIIWSEPSPTHDWTIHTFRLAQDHLVALASMQTWQKAF